MNCVKKGQIVKGGCEHLTWKTKDCKRTYTCGLVNFWQKIDYKKWKNEEREVLKMKICALKIK